MTKHWNRREVLRQAALAGAAAVVGLPRPVAARTRSANEKLNSWSIIRFDFPASGGRKPVRLTWYDGGKKKPATLVDEKQLPDNGVIFALLVGRRIEWDPMAFKITNCEEANRYLKREYRKGWESS